MIFFLKYFVTLIFVFLINPFAIISKLQVIEYQIIHGGAVTCCVWNLGNLAEPTGFKNPSGPGRKIFTGRPRRFQTLQCAANMDYPPNKLLAATNLKKFAVLLKNATIWKRGITKAQQFCHKNFYWNLTHLAHGIIVIFSDKNFKALEFEHGNTLFLNSIFMANLARYFKALGLGIEPFCRSAILES